MRNITALLSTLLLLAVSAQAEIRSIEISIFGMD
jgi:hypothetical protein